MAHPGSLAIIVLGCFVIVCAGVKLAGPVLVPIILASYLATISLPMVVALRNRRVPVSIATVLALIAVSGVLGGLFALLVRASAELASRWPVYQALLMSEIQVVSLWLQTHGLGSSSSILDLIDPGAVASVVAGVVGDLVSLLWSLMLALVVAAFLLLRFAPSASNNEHMASEPLKRAVREVNRYVVIKTATSITTGVLVGLLTWLLDADLPLLYGLLAFVLNYIPNLGSFIAAVPPLLLAMLQQGVGTTILMAGGYVLINVVIGNAVEPRIMGRALGLSPLAVLLSVIFWGWLLGMVGALFSALLTLLVKLLLLATEDLRPLGLALGPSGQSVDVVKLDEESLVDQALPQTQRPPA